MTPIIEQWTVPQILKHVVDELAEKPRAMTPYSGNCAYTVVIDGEKCHCAVGMFLKPEYQTEDFEHNENDVNKLFANEWDFEFLRPEVAEIPIGCWYDLQALHDNSCNWERHEEGKGQILSEQGVKAYNAVLFEYCPDDYKNHIREYTYE